MATRHQLRACMRSIKLAGDEVVQRAYGGADDLRVPEAVKTASLNWASRFAVDKERTGCRGGLS